MHSALFCSYSLISRNLMVQSLIPNSTIVALDNIINIQSLIYSMHSIKCMALAFCWNCITVFVLYRLVEKECMRKQEEEKLLNFHQEGFRYSNLTLSAAWRTGFALILFYFNLLKQLHLLSWSLNTLWICFIFLCI